MYVINLITSSFSVLSLFSLVQEQSMEDSYEVEFTLKI